MMIAILVALLIASLATGLIWVCSSRLEVLSEQLSIHYDLPDVVRGGVITAVASSFPELSSVVISTVWHGEFELGVATIIGSAIFNILVIPGVCTLASRKLEADRDIVYKEMLFYLLAIAVFSLTLACGVVFQPSDAAPHSGHVSRSWLFCRYSRICFISIFNGRTRENRVRKSPRRIRSISNGPGDCWRSVCFFSPWESSC